MTVTSAPPPRCEAVVGLLDALPSGAHLRHPQQAVQAGIDAGVFHERPGYGRDEMAYNLWALVHGLSVLRMTRLRSLDADYDRLHRSLLGGLVEQFERSPNA